MKIGTNEVENQVKSMCKFMKDKETLVVKKKIMRSKINDAFRGLKAEEKENKYVWRNAKKLLKDNIRTEYLEVWKEYTAQYRRLRNEKNRKKVVWLGKKWRSNDVQRNTGIPDVIRNVVVQDEELSPEFTSEARMYGNVVLSKEEKEAVKIPPNFGIQSSIDTKEVMVSVEEALNKLRWNRIIMNNQQTSNNNNNGQEEDGFIEDNKVDINKLKRTGLPFNQFVSMPRGVSEEEEIRLHKFKHEVRKVAENLRKESREWTNLSDVEARGLERLKERISKK